MRTDAVRIQLDKAALWAAGEHYKTRAFERNFTGLVIEAAEGAIVVHANFPTALQEQPILSGGSSDEISNPLTYR